jgi:hypothetical protein
VPSPTTPSAPNPLITPTTTPPTSPPSTVPPPPYNPSMPQTPGNTPPPHGPMSTSISPRQDTLHTKKHRARPLDSLRTRDLPRYTPKKDTIRMF